MALTHHSVRTCLLWGETPLFGDAPRRRLWGSFLACLETLQSPRHARAINGGDDATAIVEESVHSFLEELLGQASDTALAADLRSGLRERRPIELLWEWYAPETKDDTELRDVGTFKDDATGAVVRQLFSSALTQAFAAYALGQLAFLFGHLWLAKTYSVGAYGFLQSDDPEWDAFAKTEEADPARNLEFLTITLLIEVQFHSQGYDTLRDEENKPYARKIAHELARDRQEYLQSLPDLWEFGLKVRNGKVSGLAQDFLKNFWNPVPTDQDTKRLKVEYLDSEQSSPLALAWELSRRNRAGMLHYRYRDWHAAKREFEHVNARIKALAGEKSPVLVPVLMEARLYLGRICAQQYDFVNSEKCLREVRAYFREIQDEFADNKATKAEAELLYRRARLGQAEALLQEVSATSRQKGFVHDWASAEMYLAKIESGYGFQTAATERFARVSAHFSQYDAPRETIECLFWSTAAQARHLTLEGHPRERVIEARALLKVYRRLFEGVRKIGDTGGPLLASDFRHLSQALENKRDPDVTEAMLDLRLGRFPAQDLVDKLWKRLDKQHPGHDGAPPAGSASNSWERNKEDRLVRQILRLIALQRDEEFPLAKVGGGNQFPKMTIREEVLAALEAVARGEVGSARRAICEAQRRIRQPESELGGGLVPFLVDLSQFFLQRDSFIALLLLLLDEVDRAVRHGETASAAAFHKERGQDPGTLREAYRSVTKYLVLERNFYLGPPSFQPPSERDLPLWNHLERSYGYSRREWRLRYERAILGGHGLYYPGNAVGLGWVESVENGSVILRIAWAEEVCGDALHADHFQRLSVPSQVGIQGHAEESMAPVVLIGRQGTGAGEMPWTAHRIPLDLGELELFRGLQASPWYEPVLDSWRLLFDRFTGRVPADCVSPVLTDSDLEKIEKRYVELALFWFGDRFRESELRQIFDIQPTVEAPLEPVLITDEELLGVRLADTLKNESVRTVLEAYSKKVTPLPVSAPAVPALAGA
jgi:hypothetical protein